jgi:hypothetical protein
MGDADASVRFADIQRVVADALVIDDELQNKIARICNLQKFVRRTHAIEHAVHAREHAVHAREHAVVAREHAVVAREHAVHEELHAVHAERLCLVAEIDALAA